MREHTCEHFIRHNWYYTFSFMRTIDSLKVSAECQSSLQYLTPVRKRILFRLLMKLLCFLFQLGEAAFSIDIDSILCDLTLQTLVLAHVCASAEIGALLKLSGVTFAWWTYDVEALLDCLWRLKSLVSCLLRPNPAREEVRPYSSDTFCQALPTHFGVIRVDSVELNVQ